MKFYRSWSSVKALTFDLDDTLYDNHPIIIKAEKNLLHWLAMRLPQTQSWQNEDWQKLKEQAVHSDSYLISDVTKRRKVVLTLAAGICGLSADQAEQIAHEALAYFLQQRSDFTLPKSVFTLLDKLTSEYPLIAITNGNVDCDKLGLTPYFSHILKAGVDGEAKPHADMFNKAQSLLSLPAQSILHVGDNLFTDVMGAKNSGLKACWLNTSNKSITALEASILPDIEIKDIQQLAFL